MLLIAPHRVSKNAPTLASCSFDKDGLILLFLANSISPLLKIICMLNFPYPFTFTYFICSGNDAFWCYYGMLVKQSSCFSRKRLTLILDIISPDLCPSKSLVDYRICGLRQELVYIVQNTCQRRQPLWPATCSSTSLTHGQAYRKTSSTKQLVNGESSYVQAWRQNDITLDIC